MQPTEYTFDPHSLTMEELEDLEEYSGLTLGRIVTVVQAGEIPARLATGIVWIMRRRDEPGLSIAEVRKMSVTDLQAIFSSGKAPAGAAEPAGNAPSGSVPSSTSTVA